MKSVILAGILLGASMAGPTAVTAAEIGASGDTGVDAANTVGCHDSLDSWVPGTLRFDTRTLPGYIVPSQDTGVKPEQADCVLS